MLHTWELINGFLDIFTSYERHAIQYLYEPCSVYNEDQTTECFPLRRLATVNQMKASDELTDEQVRQMAFDLEAAHNAFYRSLAV